MKYFCLLLCLAIGISLVESVNYLRFANGQEGNPINILTNNGMNVTLAYGGVSDYTLVNSTKILVTNVYQDGVDKLNVTTQVLVNITDVHASVVAITINGTFFLIYIPEFGNTTTYFSGSNTTAVFRVVDMAKATKAYPLSIVGAIGGISTHFFDYITFLQATPYVDITPDYTKLNVTISGTSSTLISATTPIVASNAYTLFLFAYNTTYAAANWATDYTIAISNVTATTKAITSAAITSATITSGQQNSTSGAITSGMMNMTMTSGKLTTSIGTVTGTTTTSGNNSDATTIAIQSIVLLACLAISLF